MPRCLEIVCASPIHGAGADPHTYPQPDLPLTVSKSILAAALWSRHQEHWYRVLEQKVDVDHLSILQLSVRSNPLFNTGDHFTQTTLAQLRLGHSGLSAHVARREHSNPMCECGTEQETTAHFLLHCPKFDSQRYILALTLDNLLPPYTTTTEGILLGSTEFKWHKPLYKSVAKAVATYIQRTGRFKDRA